MVVAAVITALTAPGVPAAGDPPDVPVLDLRGAHHSCRKPAPSGVPLCVQEMAVRAARVMHATTITSRRWTITTWARAGLGAPSDAPAQTRVRVMVVEIQGDLHGTRQAYATLRMFIVRDTRHLAGTASQSKDGAPITPPLEDLGRVRTF